MDKASWRLSVLRRDNPSLLDHDDNDLLYPLLNTLTRRTTLKGSNNEQPQDIIVVTSFCFKASSCESVPMF